jgi:ubiquinone/menaquinone biosynthesis C-methylase UbiE
MQPENKPYHLGNTDAEHERLIRQATRIAPVTERFFRESGVASGQRVLDIGAGVGDVAMLAAKIVGPSGEVIGIERDARTIARARPHEGGRLSKYRVHSVRHRRLLAAFVV